MRQPTPPEVYGSWWLRSIRGERLPVVEDEPQCGLFRRRLVKGGPWVAAKIWLEQIIDEFTGELALPEEYRCEVDGECRDPYREWTWLASNPISQAAYEDLCRQRASNPRMAATLRPFADDGFDAVPPRPMR